MLNDTDHVEWSSFKLGNWDAYVQLYQKHFKVLNNYGYKFTTDSSLIEDAIHDLFINLWNTKSRLGDPVSVKNYLYKSLRNIIFRKIEKQMRFVNVKNDIEYPFDFEVSFDFQYIADETERELQQKIKSLISKLPARQQEIIYLRFYEGLSYEEIADIMTLNISSVYKLLYKAINKLREILKPEDFILFLCLLGMQKY